MSPNGPATENRKEFCAKPLVSVLVPTYQHRHYIQRCLDGIASQRCAFAFEILIGDDGSTDGTWEICLEFARAHKQCILYRRDRSDNDKFAGRPTGQNNIKQLLLAANGAFIALCEGDDYWTNERKLEKQIDYLQKHSEISGCFHDAQVVDGNGNVLRNSCYVLSREIYDQKQCLTELRTQYATCSLVFRASVLKDPWPSWFAKHVSDEALDLLITKYGSIAYLAENMAAYRHHSGGLWQGATLTWRRKASLFRTRLFYQDKELRNLARAELRIRISNYAKFLVQDKTIGPLERLWYFMTYLRYTYIFKDLRRYVAKLL